MTVSVAHQSLISHVEGRLEQKCLKLSSERQVRRYHHQAYNCYCPTGISTLQMLAQKRSQLFNKQQILKRATKVVRHSLLNSGTPNLK